MPENWPFPEAVEASKCNQQFHIALMNFYTMIYAEVGETISVEKLSISPMAKPAAIAPLPFGTLDVAGQRPPAHQRPRQDSNLRPAA